MNLQKGENIGGIKQVQTQTKMQIGETILWVKSFTDTGNLTVEMFEVVAYGSCWDKILNKNLTLHSITPFQKNKIPPKMVYIETTNTFFLDTFSS